MSSKMDAAFEALTKNFPMNPQDRQIARAAFIEGYACGAESAIELALSRSTPSEGEE